MNQVTNVSDFKSLLPLISHVLDYVYAFAPLLALLYIFLSALKYIAAAGDQKKAQIARDTFMHAIIGLVIIYGSYLVVREVFAVLGVSTQKITMLGINYLP